MTGRVPHREEGGVPSRTRVSYSALALVVAGRVERRRVSPGRGGMAWFVDDARAGGPVSRWLTQFCQEYKGGPYVAVPGTEGVAVPTEAGRGLWAVWTS